MKNEKATLISIYSAFFLLSCVLMYVMIEKDNKIQREVRNVFQNKSKFDNKEEQIWPKVEIQTRNN